MLQGETLKKDALEIKEYVLEAYRTLHRHPEVAHQEVWTNAYIRKQLDAMQVSYLAPKDNITVAVIDSGRPGATVGLRCDTDALPVEEKTGLPFASECSGVMHACGHDGHIAMGLGAIKLMLMQKDAWCGKVKVIFQPAEEGEDGAHEVIATGVVDDVDVFFGIHLWSAYKTGLLCAAPVVTSAAVNMFEVHITGRGGHGATPHKCADAVVAGAELVTAAQTLVSRKISPLESAVLTIGSFQAGSAGNIIAPEAVLKGTMRSLNAQTQKALVDGLDEMAQHIAAMNGCTAKVIQRPGHDAVHNDPQAADIAVRCAHMLVEDARVCGQETAMLGDDFSSYGKIGPYCYMQLGIADENKQTHYAHHNSHFRIDEDVLHTGAAWLAAVAADAGENWQQIVARG